MLHCQVAAKLLLISDAFNRNAFQRMEGEVEIEMAATIARSREIFDEAYIIAGRINHSCLRAFQHLTVKQTTRSVPKLYVFQSQDKHLFYSIMTQR